MADDNKALKTKAAPGAIAVIEWALVVHEDTMSRLEGRTVNHLSHPLGVDGRFTLDEREEARKLLIEYGAGKPTRIVQHIGDRKKPIMFETEIVRTNPALTEGTVIDAEVVTNEAENT